MSNVDNPSAVLEATGTFICEVEGVRYIVNEGETHVSASHVLARTYPDKFRPVEAALTFEDERATNNPGEHRERPVASAKTSAPADPPRATSGIKTKTTRS